MTTKDEIAMSGSVTAPMDAATLTNASMLVEHLVAECDDFGPETATALRLLASHARTSNAELDAWKQLVTCYRKAVRGVSLRDDALDSIDDAEDALRAMGIDPATGERIATEDPR